MDERRQKIEEALSIVWEEFEKDNSVAEKVRRQIVDKLGEDMVGDLVNDGFVELSGDSIRLANKGAAQAKDVVRRQRLAERLLVDVLEVGGKEMDSCACEFEHIISREVEVSICTLLGHPKECPHGLAIPPGICCSEAGEKIKSIVIPLSRFKPGENARIVYVLTHQHPQLHKLMSFGIVPGALVNIHQIFPTFVIQVGHTQLAIENEIAEQIYAKRV